MIPAIPQIPEPAWTGLLPIANIPSPPKGWKPRKTFMVLQPHLLDGEHGIWSPGGFLSDAGSLPWIARGFHMFGFPDWADTRFLDLFVSHDKPYWTHEIPFKLNNEILRDRMVDRGASKRVADIFYKAVSSNYAKRYWQNEDSDFEWMAHWASLQCNIPFNDRLKWPAQVHDVLWERLLP